MASGKTDNGQNSMQNNFEEVAVLLCTDFPVTLWQRSMQQELNEMLDSSHLLRLKESSLRLLGRQAQGRQVFIFDTIIIMSSRHSMMIRRKNSLNGAGTTPMPMKQNPMPRNKRIPTKRNWQNKS